jgi:hypothetical protein
MVVFSRETGDGKSTVDERRRSAPACGSDPYLAESVPLVMEFGWEAGLWSRYSLVLQLVTVATEVNSL